MLDQLVWPPRERGITCSNVSAEAGSTRAQYWHVKRSRRSTLKRVKATRRDCRRYLRSATTDGSRTCVDGLCTQASYSATTVTRPQSTAVTASCHDSSESGK